MKLIQMAVSGYKCISGGLEENKISLENNKTIFIIGQNNVGKSTFLKAYRSYYDNKLLPEDFTYVEEGVPAKDIEMELWFEIEEAKDKPRIDASAPNKYESLKGYLNNNILKVRRVTQGTAKKVGETKNFTLNPTTNDWEEKSYGGIGLDGIFQYLIPKPIFIQAMPTEEEVKNIVNDILKEVANSKLSKAELAALVDAQKTISDLQDKVYDPAMIKSYEDVVNSMFKNLFNSYKIKIDDGKSRLKYTHDKLGKDFEIDFLEENSNRQTSYYNMGHGAVRMAIFLLMLMRDKLEDIEDAERGYIVLFEEPELFLHPKLAVKLRNLVYEVSGMPHFQILCASHSPQMIDLTKKHSSIVRMVRSITSGTQMLQISEEDLKQEEDSSTEELRERVYEVLRFNPYVCESFYADEVVLVEGDTEALIWRGYMQKFESQKDIYVVNCGTVNNIPFYQKVFSNFKIPYSVICDTDEGKQKRKKDFWDGEFESPNFTSHIQKTISDLYHADNANGIGKKFYVCSPTFEPMHNALADPFKYESDPDGKAIGANNYWQKIAQKTDHEDFSKIPIIKYIRSIIEA